MGLLSSIKKAVSKAPGQIVKVATAVPQVALHVTTQAVTKVAPHSGVASALAEVNNARVTVNQAMEHNPLATIAVAAGAALVVTGVGTAAGVGLASGGVKALASTAAADAAEKQEKQEQVQASASATVEQATTPIVVPPAASAEPMPDETFVDWLGRTLRGLFS